jgi:superoxide dismutase, Cu-Zn family
MRSIIILLFGLVAGQRTAFAKLNPDILLQNQERKVTGNVSFTQADIHILVSIHLQLDGLVPNSIHGWHVHVNGLQGENCTTAGLHFNPMNRDHGAPEDDNRHFGDLGNFQADDFGKVDFRMEDRLLNLFNEAEQSPIQRAIVIHERLDDLGMRNAPSSKTVGNSGSRLACGVLQGDFDTQTKGNPTKTGDPIPNTKVPTSMPTWSSSTGTIPIFGLAFITFL